MNAGSPLGTGAVAAMDSEPFGSGAKPVRKDLDASLKFGFLIHDVSRMRRIVVDRALKPLGLTRSQWWVLAFLSRRDGMSLTALAADLDLTKVAVGGLIERMEASGLVERRNDERDARAKRVFLTQEGKSLVKRIRSHVESVEADILASVADAELDVAADVLVKIKHRLLAMIGEQPDPSVSDRAAESVHTED